MNFVDTVRFAYDVPAANEEAEGRNVARELLYAAVVINADTFPRMWALIGKTFENIGASHKGHLFFVQASHEVQATCVRSGDSAAFLFSSALVERFDDDEILFVIGHEYGHHHFKHGHIPVTQDAKAVLRSNVLRRAAEITADRVGLLAAKNLNAAIAALIKTATGLDGRNVRFQANSFLRQYNALIKHGPSPREAMSSHPFFLMRLRALLLFSRSREYAQTQGASGYNLMGREEIDAILRHDLQRLSGVALDDIESDIIRDAILMGAFLVFANDGKITKEEQGFVKEYIGDVDFSHIMQLLREGGIERLSYEFETVLNYIQRTPFPKADLTRLQNTLGLLLETFPEEDTKNLKHILKGRDNFMGTLKNQKTT
jgi:hypothetical protein